MDACWRVGVLVDCMHAHAQNYATSPCVRTKNCILYFVNPVINLQSYPIYLQIQQGEIWTSVLLSGGVRNSLRDGEALVHVMKHLVVAGSAADFLWSPPGALPGLGEAYRLSSEFAGLPSGLPPGHPSVCSGSTMPPTNNMGPLPDYLQPQLVDSLLHVGYGMSQALIPPPHVVQRNLHSLTPYLQDDFSLGVSHCHPATRRPSKLEASRVFLSQKAEFTKTR